MTHTKQQILDILQDPDYVAAAIIILGQNQTADELRTKTTNRHNDIGFSAAYGKVGTRFYEFVTGISTRSGEKKWQPKSLAHPTANRVFGRYINNHGLNDAVELGRKIALVHWRQLEGLTTATVAELPSAGDAPKKKRAPEQVTFKGAEILRRSGKAVQVLWDSQKVWLPTSQIKWNSETEELTLPKWLAKKKGMAERINPVDEGGFNWETGEQEEPPGPQPGTWAFTARMMAAGDNSGFDWDAWKDEMKERDM